MLGSSKISRETITTRKTFPPSVKYPEWEGTESFQTSQLDLDAEGFLSCMIQRHFYKLLLLITQHSFWQQHTQDCKEQHCSVWDLDRFCKLRNTKLGQGFQAGSSRSLASNICIFISYRNLKKSSMSIMFHSTISRLSCSFILGWGHPTGRDGKLGDGGITRSEIQQYQKQDPTTLGN